jgi:hypothetical protein
MFLGVFLDPDIHWVADFRFAAPLHRLTTQTNHRFVFGFSVSGFAIDLVCSGLKSERDTLEKGFLPIPAFSSVAAVGRTAAKTWPSAGPGKN